MNLKIMGMCMSTRRIGSIGLVAAGAVGGILISLGITAVAQRGEPLPLRELQQFANVFAAIKNTYVEPLTDQALVNNAIKGLFTDLDPHSAYLDAEAFRSIARSGDLATVLDGLQQARAAGMQIKINMVPLRGQNLDQVLPLLDYCLANGFELRFIELMRMGHLARDGNGFQRQFVGMPELLELIGSRYDYIQAHAPLDATALRFAIPEVGHFGVIANESVPFCRTCSRLRLSSTGWLHGCLSSSNRHYVGDLLEKPRHQALPALQGLLVKALGDKQDLAFSGGATVMKIIGG